MKCKVCGKRFKLQADKRYEVLKKPDGFARVLSGKATVCYEGFDCPRCGCQNIANIREKSAVKEKKYGTLLPKGEVETFVSLINRVSIEACIHGADLGGSYDNNKEGLIDVLENIKTSYGLTEYDIGEICNDDGWYSYGFKKKESEV